VRARALTLVGAALAAGLAGCTAANTSSVTVSGKALTIYLSRPGGMTPEVQDVLDAERLAYSQLASSVTAYKLRLTQVSASKPSDNARTAIEDTSTIAYLGEIVPGTSTDSAGITNAQDVLQVSPTDTALELTASTSYYESYKTYGRTFARVVPNAMQEARAQVQEMRALGVKRLYVASDGSSYGSSVAAAVQSAAGPTTTTTSASSADAMFYGASSASAAARFFNKANPKLKLFGPSSLDSGAFASALSPSLRNVFVSSPGFLERDYTAAARSSFLRPFEAAYGHAPAPDAIFGYEAMAALLAVIHEDGSLANERSKVVHDFFAIKNRSSVLGTYSLNSNGDTSLAPFVFSRLQGGKLVPFRFVQAQG
jgi:branched-chain amino acid transport system substrate-binding protein